MDFDKDPAKAKDFLTQYTQAVGNDDPKRADAVSAAQGAQVTRRALTVARCGAACCSRAGAARRAASRPRSTSRAPRTRRRPRKTGARAGPTSEASARPAPASSESNERARPSDGDDAGGDSRRPPPPRAARTSRARPTRSAPWTSRASSRPRNCLYFLNRVKLELDMSAPDKRSFMKELQQSADDKNL